MAMSRPAEGSARPAAETVPTPPLPARGDGDPMLPTAYVVAGKRQELADTWTLELEPAEGDGVGEFSPGQFSMLYAFGAGEVPISVSSIDGGRLVHTVRAVGSATAARSGRAGRSNRRREATWSWSPAGSAWRRFALRSSDWPRSATPIGRWRCSMAPAPRTRCSTRGSCGVGARRGST